MQSYIAEINAAQLKFLKEFFMDYEDEKIKCRLKDDSNRIKAIFEVNSDLTAEQVEAHMKSVFKSKSKYASALYYTIHVK